MPHRPARTPPPGSPTPGDRAAATCADPRWACVCTRDARADGRFVYAVSSTGVYCRPSCPSRRARPEHVRFFDQAGDARAAGFRPCARCHPDEPAADAPLQRAVAAACRAIEAALDRAEPAPTVEALAAALGLSASHLHRAFRRLTGLTPGQWARARCASAVRAQLAAGAPVTEALQAAGYGSASRFYAQAPGVLGMAPATYRRGGAGETLRHATGRCSLGVVLVAASARGLCAITLGEDADTLVADLHRRFPQARHEAAGDDFSAQLAQVIAFVDQPRTGLALPLDLRGTAFQQRVWQALRDIPPGRTASYAELAARLGAPQAARAVAGACAANPLAVAVPCHRVVRGDGALSGYRWGVARKRALLDREAGAGETPVDAPPADHPAGAPATRP